MLGGRKWRCFKEEEGVVFWVVLNEEVMGVCFVVVMVDVQTGGERHMWCCLGVENMVKSV